MPNITIAEVVRDYETDGVPSSGKHKPKKSDWRKWGAWVEQIITAFTSNGGLIYSNRAGMDADLAHAANSMAWVLGDATVANNGIYRKSGASGIGSWIRMSDLPFSFIIASDVGAGTPNAIQATTSLPVSGSGLVWMNVADTNTASPVTVSFNGGSPLTIKTASGTNVAVGGLPAGMIILGIVSGSTFRLVSEQSGTAFLAQLQEMLDEATQLATPADGTVTQAKLSPELAASSPLAVNLFGIGETFWDARFDAAIDAAVGFGGADIYIPRGEYLLTEREIPANVRLMLDGGAIIKPRAATSSLFKITGGLSGVIGGKFENVSSMATRGIVIDKPADDTPVTVEGGYYALFTEAIRSDGGDCLFIKHNRAVSNGVFLNVTEDGRNSNVIGNDVLGGSGFHFSKTTTFEAEGVLIFGNKVRPSTAGIFCVQLEGGLNIVIESNCFDQITTGPGIFIDGQVNDVREIIVLDNWIGRAAGAASADYGLFGVGQIRSLTSDANVYVGFQQAAINLNGLAGGTLIGFVSHLDRFHSADPSLRDIQLTFAEGVEINGADFSGDATIVENTGVDGIVLNSDFSKASNLPSITGGLRYGGQRKGMTLLNKGASSLPANGDGVTINHGLSYAPSLADFNITTGSVATDDPGPIRVTNITSTQFIVAPRVAPNSVVDFGWKVDMRR